jgi:hypothetical protein
MVLFITALVWVPSFILRVQAHQSNVDDFLYTGVARQLTVSPTDFVRGVLLSGQNSPLVPMLSALGARLYGVYGAMAMELPLLLLLVAGAYVLARIWLGPFAAALTSVVVGCNHAVMSYAVMLNFAVASTAAIVWSFATYFRSDHLRDWRWSFGFGIATAALLLSRSVAPVYFVPLVVVVGVDIVVDLRRRGQRSWQPALGAIAVLIVLAGPWWLFSGGTSLHYLLSAGYQPSSGYVTHGAQLTPSSVVQRITWSLYDLGWFQAVVLGIGVGFALIVSVLRSDLRRQRGVCAMTAWIVLTILLLASSGNQGTGFAIPVLTIVIILSATLIGNLTAKQKTRSFIRNGRLGSGVALFAVVVVLGVGVASIASTSSDPWWPAAPYRLEVVESGGSSRTNIDALTAEVAQAVGTSHTIVARDDDIFNTNGLVWEAESHGLRSGLERDIPHNTQAVIEALPGADTLVTGNSQFPYWQIDQIAVEAAAVRDGFKPIHEWHVGPGNTVVLWKRN